MTEQPARQSRSRKAIALLAALFLFFPVIALAAGARPTDFENHKLAKFPSASSGWQFFQQLPSWATDHLATRQQWVKAYGSVNRHVFSDPAIPPSDSPQAANDLGPTVLVGKAGTLYLGYDVQYACAPTRTETEIVQFLRELAKVITDSGRTFLLYVPPDKTTFEPQFLPDSFIGKDCTQARSAAMWPLMSKIPGFVDLRPGLEQVAAGSSGPLYIPTDSHWNGLAASVYVRSLINQIDPSVKTYAPTALPPVRLKADLTVLSGDPKMTTVHPFSIVNPLNHVSSGPIPDFFDALDDIHAAGPPDALVRPTTTLLADSFTNIARLDRLETAFSHLYLTHYNRTATDGPAILKAIDSSQVVALEMIQRATFTGRETLLFDDDFLDRLKANLATHPLE